MPHKLSSKNNSRVRWWQCEEAKVASQLDNATAPYPVPLTQKDFQKRRRNRASNHRYVWNDSTVFQNAIDCAKVRGVSSTKTPYYGPDDRVVQQLTTLTTKVNFSHSLLSQESDLPKYITVCWPTDSCYTPSIRFCHILRDLQSVMLVAVSLE